MDFGDMYWTELVWAQYRAFVVIGMKIHFPQRLEESGLY